MPSSNAIHAVRGITNAKAQAKRLRRKPGRSHIAGQSKSHQELLGEDVDEQHAQVVQRRAMEVAVRGVFEEDENSQTYELVKAIEQDDMDWLEELLEQAVPVNPRLKHGEFHGQTALIWAVRCGNLPATEMLINAGADPFIPDEKYRDAWYYACFGRNISDGEHKSFMAALLERWPIDEKVMLMAAHSQHAAVKRTALDALPIDLLSRDSKNFCEWRFQHLRALDCQCETAQLTWPDGSKSRLQLTAFQKLVETESTDAVAHPAMMTALHWKWYNFGWICFLIDAVFYILTLVSVSGVAVVYSDPMPQTDAVRHWTYFMLISNALMLVQEVYQAYVVLRAERSLKSLYGRHLHAFISCSLAFACYGLMRAGGVLDAPDMSAEHADMSRATEVLAAATIFTWLRMLYFIQLFRDFGSFCIVLVEMMKRDVTKFAALMTGVAPGFMLAIHMLMVHSCAEEFQDGGPGARWLAYNHLLSNMLFMVLGVVSWDGPVYECMDTPPIIICIQLYLLFTAIVLLNLMIAMFSDTYERIQTQAAHQWALNLAKYIKRKEHLMDSLGFVPARKIHLDRTAAGWSFDLHAKHEHIVIPQLRGDGDERPEEYILEQLDIMWTDLRKRNEGLQAQLTALTSPDKPRTFRGSGNRGGVAWAAAKRKVVSSSVASARDGDEVQNLE
mmetsp:Transcript_35944/g.90658  ORF Transcript_35944/g.90658 Transcript_35944/m.90658 type:complete len:672 (-) Transcript_35944:174-2189(-)